MTNITGFQPSTPPGNQGTPGPGSPSKNEGADKIKRTFSDKLSRESSDLSPEKKGKTTLQASKRQKKSIDVKQAAQSKQWDVLLDYFKDNPKQLFKEADMIKSELETGNMNFHEFLPILSAAAKNLKELKKPVFDPPSIEVIPPKSLFRLFDKELSAFIESTEFSPDANYFETLVKQDNISVDPYLSSRSVSKNVLKNLFLTAQPDGTVLLENSEILKSILPVFLDRLPYEEFYSVITSMATDTLSYLDLLTPECIKPLNIAQCLLLGQVLANKNLALTDCLPPVAQRYISTLEITDLQTPHSSGFIEVLQSLAEIPMNEKIAALACYIEYRKIPLQNVIQHLTPDEFILMGTHLRFVNLIDFEDAPLAKRLLSACPNLQTLFINNSNLLEGINALPGCISFSCYDCNDDFQIPELPDCEFMELSGCALVSSIPALKQCRILYLSHCPALARLPNDLDLCTILYLLNCPSLTWLPQSLPSCIIFRCYNCTHLRRLPAVLPICHHFHFVNCPLVREIPDMPECNEFICQNCQRISDMPAHMLRCNFFILAESPFVMQIPELHPFAHVQWDRVLNDLNEEPSLLVDFEELKTHPKKYLMRLSDHLFIENSFPEVRYQENGSPNIAIDAGGIGRDLVTRLCENLFKAEMGPGDRINFLMMRDGIPLATNGDESEKEAYSAFGSIMAYCCDQSSTFKIGPLFDERVYECLIDIPVPYYGLENLVNSRAGINDDWLIRSYARLKASMLDNEKLRLLIDLEKDPPQLTKEELECLSALAESDACPTLLSQDMFEDPAKRVLIRQSLLDNAKLENSLQAIESIAHGLLEELEELALQDEFDQNEWNVLKSQGARAIKERIEGIVSAEALKDRIEWECVGHVDPVKYENTVKFMTDWIDQNNSEERLGLFIYAVTGTRTLSSIKLHIKILHKENQAVPAPTASTCGFALYLPADYQNQEQFNKKLEILLTEGMAGTGFSMA